MEDAKQIEGERMSQKILAVCLTTALTLTALSAPTGTFATKGFEFRPKIVGGVPAEKGEFPFQVSLQSSSGSHFCGGSLIKKNWVLTAAHCVTRWSNSNKIVIGLHDLKDKTDTENFTSVKVISHPQYNSRAFDYDYALIKLNGDSKFRSIELNSTEIDIPNTDLPPINVWTAGWGTTAESGSLARVLNKVEIPLVTTEACNATTAYDGDITDRMICAGLIKGGKDSCQGDSGGPLFMTQTSGDFLLLGVVSWGEGCARPNKYGVYSKVNVVVDWISTQTQ